MNPLEQRLRTSRIVKTLRPGRPGTKKQSAQHGEVLVCVRYRHDALGLYRYTTIELVTDAALLIDPKRFDRTSFGIHIRPGERRQRLAAIALGARWSETDGLWWLRGGAIRKLRMMDRIRSR